MAQYCTAAAEEPGACSGAGTESCSGVDALPLHGVESFGPDLPLPLLEDLLADPLLQAHEQGAPSAALSGDSSRSSATCGRPACGAGACGCAPAQTGAPRSAADLLDSFARQLAEREDGFELGAASSAARSPSRAGLGSPEAVTVLQQQLIRADAAACTAAPAGPYVHMQPAGAAQAQQAAAAGASGAGGSSSAPASRGGSMSPQASAAPLPCSSGDSSAAAAARAGPGPNPAGAKRQRSGEECSSSAAAAGSSAAASIAPAAAPSAQLVAPGAAYGSLSSHAPGGQASSGEESEEQKRAARMARNRESALHSRQRKKMQADELERRCDALAADNRRLAGMPATAAKVYTCFLGQCCACGACCSAMGCAQHYPHSHLLGCAQWPCSQCRFIGFRIHGRPVLRCAGLVQQLSTENLALRHHLAAAQQAAGAATPAGPGNLNPTGAGASAVPVAPAAAPAGVPAGAPVLYPGAPAVMPGYAPMAWMPALPLGVTPKARAFRSVLRVPRDVPASCLRDCLKR